MSGVGLVGIAAEGNENVFLNDNRNSLFHINNFELTIEHFAKYSSSKNLDGPTTVALDIPSNYLVSLPMEDDGIGAAMIQIRLPHITSTRQEEVSWNRNLVAAMIDRIELKANKNVVRERTGHQLLQETQTQLNTTRSALFHRLTGMTKENYHPHYQTYTNREFAHKYSPLIHQTIRTHGSFGHMVDRPVDLTAGQLSDPTIKLSLWLQHLKQTQSDAFFTQLGTTRENVTLAILQDAALQDIANSSLSVATQLEPYLFLAGHSNIQTQVVNTSATFLTNLMVQSKADDYFYYRKQMDIDGFLKWIQDIETDWTNETFLTKRETKVNFVSTISSFNVSGGNTNVTLSVTKDLQGLNNVSNQNTTYLFEIHRDLDLYGYPNSTQQFVANLTNVNSESNSMTLTIDPDWVSFINTTTDDGLTVIHLLADHVGYVNAISQISGAISNDTAYYTIDIRDTTPLANFTVNDTRQVLIGNTTIDFYLYNSTSANITIPKSDITDPTAFVNATILLRDPTADALLVTHNSTITDKSTYEYLRNAFPTSWDYNARPYVSYRDILANTTVQEAIPDLANTTANTTINFIMQEGVVNATLGELSIIQSVLDSVGTGYTSGLSNAVAVFAGLQESYVTDRYGGYYPDYRLVQNTLHGMNNLLIRLKQIAAIQSNVTTNLSVNYLLPKLTQQYGVISYHYHRDIFKTHTNLTYQLLNEFATFSASSGYFPGTLDEVNVTIANTSAQFPESNVMSYSLFDIPEQRDELMNHIDFVNGTVQFVTEAETGVAYNVNYFTLNDLSTAPSGVDEIVESEEYRFIFWWRVFQFLDKCALVKEAWLNRLYNSSLSYLANLEALRDTYNLEYLAICIQLYDQFKKLYPIVYDRYRLRAPSLTQQNLPFSRDVYLNTAEQASANVTLLGTNYDIEGTVPGTYSYLYQNYRFPQETPTGFSHLYQLTSNIFELGNAKDFTISLLRAIQSNITNTNTANVLSELPSTYLELLNDSYFTTVNSVSDTLGETYEILLSTLWENPSVTEYMPNVSNLVVFPTKQEGGFFQSKRGSSMGFIVAKEFGTGVVYEGFQTETQDWSNITQYDNRVGNLVADVGPYKSYQLSASDILGLTYNSTGINLSTFFSSSIANVSPQVFAYRVNQNNPIPVTYEPRTYRSYNYRIPKYIPQAKWEGCETSLVSMLSNPLLEYFEYLRINLVHPDDIPAALMATNYGEILSQGDDPWFLSHSQNKLSVIQNRLGSSTSRELTSQEETGALTEVGWRQTSAARVTDPVTKQSVVAFSPATLVSPMNASRNPYRNEQVYDMNLRLLYRNYLSVSNQLDTVNAIETPNYIPRHLQDICNRIVLRCMQEYFALYLVETTPTSRTVTVNIADLKTEEYMVQEIRTVLTEFLRLLSKSNIPIENHRSVKVAFMKIWRRWHSMMVRYIRIGVVDELMELVINIVSTVYTQVMIPKFNLNQYGAEQRTQKWLEILYAIMALEEALDIEIDATKDDDDWLLLVYARLPDFVRDKLYTNPFELVRTDIIAFKNLCLNMLIGV